MTTRMIIFDLDGTIADTVEAGVRMYNAIAQKRNYRLITEENRDHLRTLEARMVIKELGIPWWRVPYVATRVRQGLVDHIADIAIYEGMKETIEKLSQCYTVALVTSNSLENARAFLSAHSITAFDAHMYAGVNIFGKARRIRRLLADTRVMAHEAIYVGDEVRDVVAAHAVGVPVIAVTWGLNSHEALVRAQPEHIVHFPQEISHVLEPVVS